MRKLLTGAWGAAGVCKLNQPIRCYLIMLFRHINGPQAFPFWLLCVNRERSVKCILRWALGWKVLFPPTWEPIHGQFETVGREGRVLAIGAC
jgi:hypothetical protein